MYLGGHCQKAPTDAYLRARNAHLRVETTESANFYGLRLDSVTHIDAFGYQLLLHIKLINPDTLQLLLYEMPTRKPIYDVAATMNQDADTGNLNYKTLRMTMSFDALPADAAPTA